MNEKEIKHGIKRFFQHLGFSINDLIPDSTSKKPDFEVLSEEERYLVELKIKDDDPKQIEEEINTIRKGTVAGRVTSVSPRNTLSGIINKGIK